MKNRKNILCLSAMAAMLLVGCKSSVWNFEFAPIFEAAGETEYNKLKERSRSETYSYYSTYLPETFNTVTSMQAEDGKIIANLVDGLVETDKYGKIVPALAESYVVNEESTEFTFKIRQGVKWMTHTGAPYQVDGKNAEVSAHDWVKGAKEVLTAANGSESYYLISMFVEGADEYYTVTSFKQQQASGFGVVTEEKRNAYVGEDKDALLAKCKVGTIGSPKGSCKNVVDFTAYTDAFIEKKLGMTSTEIAEVLSFSKVGIKASDDGKTLTYKLAEAAPYFVTALTYTPYLPVFSQFYDKVGGSNYGSSPTNFLYNGGYIINSFKGATATELKLHFNPEYWDLPAIKTKTINIQKIPTQFSDSDSRKGFERGDIDSFVVNQKDDEGWKKYVAGADGTGTILNPASPEAYAHEGKGDGSTFGFMLNVNRDAEQPYKSDLSKEQIENGNKAFQDQRIRKALLGGLDYEAYNLRNGIDPLDKVWLNRETVNTYTPKNFITDQKTGKDYQDIIQEAYAAKFGVTLPEATKVLSTGQIGGLALTDAETVALLTEAKSSASKVEGIEWPIRAEYVGLSFDNGQKNDDSLFVAMSQYRLNGCVPTSYINNKNGVVSSTLPLPAALKDKAVCPGNGVAPYIDFHYNVQPVDQNDYQAFSNNKSFTLLISGWGPDYSDPLTFANTLVADGDLCDYVGMCLTEDEEYNENNVNSIIGKYTELVETAKKIVSADLSTKRLEAFAVAELELLYNSYITRPLQMRGLGPSVRISKGLPNRVTEAPYGLSSYKHKNVEILDQMLSRDERAALIAEYKRLK